MRTLIPIELIERGFWKTGRFDPVKRFAFGHINGHTVVYDGQGEEWEIEGLVKVEGCLIEAPFQVRTTAD